MMGEQLSWLGRYARLMHKHDEAMAEEVTTGIEPGPDYWERHGMALEGLVHEAATEIASLQDEVRSLREEMRTLDRCPKCGSEDVSSPDRYSVADCHSCGEQIASVG